MSSTSIQETNSVRFGSGILEIGATVGALVNIGAFRNARFEEAYEKVSVMSDNAGEVYAGIRDHKCAVSCDLIEVNLDTLDMVQAGLVTVTSTGTTPVGVTDEEIDLYDTIAYRLANRNAAGTEVASITVTGDGGSPSYARNTDYVIAVDSAGYTTIARVSGGGITSGDTVEIDYTYTPASERNLTTGGLVQLTPQVVRFTNYDASGNVFEITVYKATAAEGITLEFPADDADDVWATPIRLEGTRDTTRSNGDQLFAIRDEQHAT